MRRELRRRLGVHLIRLGCWVLHISEHGLGRISLTLMNEGW